MDKIKSIALVIEDIDKQLRNERFVKNGITEKTKLWENTFIKKQIDRRNRGEKFEISDHIGAMVYSMLSSCISWERFLKHIDEKTGRITIIDSIFCNYDTESLLQCTPNQLTCALKADDIKCVSQSTFKQMTALLNSNIHKLIEFESKNNSIDEYYQSIIDNKGSVKGLITALSDSKSNDKMKQLGIALACEYLRNVGYDISKPDRHLRRLFGKNYLGVSEKEEVTPFEVFDIVNKIKDESSYKSAAQIDYILWSYCANGYGEICTKRYSNCEICKLKQYCVKGNTYKTGEIENEKNN